MDCHTLNHAIDTGMKSYNPFPIIHRCKYDFKFEESTLKARAMGHVAAAREATDLNKYKTHYTELWFDYQSSFFLLN